MSSTTVTTTKLNPLALAGFIVALVGLVLFITNWIGAVIALVGVVLSIVGRTQAVRRGERGKGLATAGIICGIVGVVLGAVVFVVIASAVMSQLQN